MSVSLSCPRSLYSLFVDDRREGLLSQLARKTGSSPHSTHTEFGLMELDGTAAEY